MPLNNNKYILHIDGDSFFASCEVAIDPSLRAKAVVTGQERGIVTAMSHDAKKRGVSRGMPIYQVKKLFPDVVVVQSNYKLYSLFSRRMVNIVRRYSNIVHEYSIDECFADLSEVIKEGGNVEDVARSIKFDLQNELGVTFSLGVASTKVLAKVASKTRKPNGLTILKNDQVKDFLVDLPIQKIWGIGRETSAYLFKKGIKTAYDFISLSEPVVKAMLSKPYYEIYLELKGISVFSCQGEKESSKSISRTRTFKPSSSDRNILYSELSLNVEDACKAIRSENLVSRGFSFFLKSQNFLYFRQEVRLDSHTSSPEDILLEIRKRFDKIYRKEIVYRATGITLFNLKNKDFFTLDLFDTFSQTKKRNELYRSIDEILNKQGGKSLYLASSLSALGKTNLRQKEKRMAFIDSLPFPYLGEVL
jgi:DNA polymerase IV